MRGGAGAPPAKKSVTAPPLRSITAPDFTALSEQSPYVAGIRPYREGGVRLTIDAPVEAHGRSRTVIHNYGHGGAGMTLSFSSADTVRGFVERLQETKFGAAGLPDVAVIGAGVIGLTTAHALITRWPSLKISIYAQECDVTRTTSYLAGGQFALASSLPEYRSSAEQALLDRLLESSERVVVELGRKGLHARYGIARRTSYSLDPENGGGNVRLKLGSRIAGARQYDSWLIDPTRMLPALRQELVSRGVQFVPRTFASEADLYSLDENLIVNCMGFGAKAVTRDARLEGRRGHLVVLQNAQKLNYFLNSWCGDAGLRYLFARHDDIVIGGTAHKDFDGNGFDPTDAGDVRAVERLLRSARSVFESGSTRCA